MNNNLTNKILISIIASILSVILTFAIARIFFLDETSRERFFVLMASIIGGMCTLIGVIMTLEFTRKSDEKNNRENNKPEVYIPIRPDIYNAVVITMLLNTDKENREYFVPNKKLYIKNTDKASLSVVGVFINGKYELIPENTVFIEKSELMCLSFYFAETVNKMILTIKSSDNNKYSYEIIFDNDNPMHMKEKDNYVNNKA